MIGKYLNTRTHVYMYVWLRGRFGRAFLRTLLDYGSGVSSVQKRSLPVRGIGVSEKDCPSSVGKLCEKRSLPVKGIRVSGKLLPSGDTLGARRVGGLGILGGLLTRTFS